MNILTSFRGNARVPGRFLHFCRPKAKCPACRIFFVKKAQKQPDFPVFSVKNSAQSMEKFLCSARLRAAFRPDGCRA